MDTLIKKTRISMLMQYSLFLCLMTMAAAPGHAATVSFLLNESNRLSDGVDYLSVNLTENVTGGVDVLAKTLNPPQQPRRKAFRNSKIRFQFR
ncbi:hypothetical protein [Sulfuricaulis sp.]|jgi:hypothetical protein|uniref:hypothetical protein n=1 Tax=Sulfuricaulis sp. TaxID=2003553 RepID=UPI00355A4867